MNPFNSWKPFPKKKPRDDGWYICTIEVPHQQRYIMNLWYDSHTAQWIDNIRQSVFDVYHVYSILDPEKRLYTVPICNRTEDVKFWKKDPKPCYRGFIKHD